MTINKTGGYAFPHDSHYVDKSGMTLRDYFAGQAISGLCANDSATARMSPAELGECSYQVADAMLEARK